ncbi:hypothetical protein VPHD273_0069 [Vibrio phage D273]|nr:hypothetical protein PODOV060v1_p0012 [Vibrio phage 234P8]QZI91513.1 hypothetical protein PODOV087v1_p0008 [Vibrio phage 431E45.1]QZI91624.1 hypothetical protein PODOV086v1_p0040 [Vibrio phage 431E46.1]QZI91733.1 hypothetical protein PODOV088v1_p0072 [Vibrio phage 431E48.2]
MKTEMEMEMVTAHIYLRSWVWNNRLQSPELVIYFQEQEDSDSFIFKKLCEAQVAMPKLSQDDIDKLMAGAELDALHAAKEKLKADTHRQLMQIDERIGQLTAIEDKGQQC